MRVVRSVNKCGSGSGSGSGPWSVCWWVGGLVNGWVDLCAFAWVVCVGVWVIRIRLEIPLIRFDGISRDFLGIPLRPQGFLGILTPSSASPRELTTYIYLLL